MRHGREKWWQSSLRALAGPLLLVGLLVGSLAAWADPPARAGRISALEGDVRLLPDRDGDWRGAGINWPLTAGSRLESGRFARAEVRIGAMAVRLGEETTLGFARLDDERIVIDLDSGSIDLRVRGREMIEQLEVTTPQARIVFSEPGRYRIDVADRRDATVVTAREGMAYVYGEHAAMAVPAGRRGELLGGRPDYALGDPLSDDFDSWVLAQERREGVAANTYTYVSADMTGYEVLDRYGSWSTTADYGAVWYPSVVPVGWAPYRFGEWVWFSTWGWTWVDNAPWGFAPSHYGRWVVLSGRWCWVPGSFVTHPVFAPALVHWKQPPQSWSQRVTAPSRGSWVPLGPQERFVPIYRASEQHVERLNRPLDRRLAEAARRGDGPRVISPSASRVMTPMAWPSPLRPPVVVSPQLRQDPQPDQRGRWRDERRGERRDVVGNGSRPAMQPTTQPTVQPATPPAVQPTPLSPTWQHDGQERWHERLLERRLRQEGRRSQPRPEALAAPLVVRPGSVRSNPPAAVTPAGVTPRPPEALPRMAPQPVAPAAAGQWRRDQGERQVVLGGRMAERGAGRGAAAGEGGKRQAWWQRPHSGLGEGGGRAGENR